MLVAKEKYSSSFSPGLLFLIFAVLMFFIYAPLFFIQFGRLNDYAYVLTASNVGLLGYSEAQHLMNIGRPLGAVLVSIQAMLISSVDGLTINRFLSFLGYLITAYFIFNHYVKKKLLEPVLTLLVVFLIITLPCVQLVISWVSNALPAVLTVLIAVIAYVLLDKVTTLRLKSSHFKSNIFFLFLSFIVFMAALYIYPANALFVLIFPLSNILFSSHKDWQETRLIVLRDLIFVIAACIFYYVSIKVMLFSSSEVTNEAGTYYDFSLGLFSGDITEKIAYMIHVLLLTLDGFQLTLFANLGLPLAEVSGYTDTGRMHSSAWWQRAWISEGEPSVIMPKVLFLGLFSLGCLSAYFSPAFQIRGNTLYVVAQMTVVVLFVILFSIAPITVPKYATLVPPGLRNTIPISAVWILISLWSVLSIKRLVMKDKEVWILPVVLAVVVGASTMSNLITSSLNAHMELSFIRQMLSSRDLSKIERVVLLGSSLEWSGNYNRLSKPSSTLIGKGLHGEFYLLGANNSMQPMVEIALREMGWKHDRPLVGTYSHNHFAVLGTMQHNFRFRTAWTECAEGSTCEKKIDSGNCPTETCWNKCIDSGSCKEYGTKYLMERHWNIDEDPTEYPKYFHLSNELWDKSNRIPDEESTLIINMNHAKLRKSQAVPTLKP